MASRKRLQVIIPHALNNADQRLERDSTANHEIGHPFAWSDAILVRHCVLLEQGDEDGGTECCLGMVETTGHFLDFGVDHFVWCCGGT